MGSNPIQSAKTIPSSSSVERLAVNEKVVGSTPTWGAISANGVRAHNLSWDGKVRCKSSMLTKYQSMGKRLIRSPWTRENVGSNPTALTKMAL